MTAVWKGLAFEPPGKWQEEFVPPKRDGRPQGRASYFPAEPLIESPNVVPSFSLGLAAQRPTPGNMFHKIHPLISRECGPREARIKITANSLAANFPKIQNSTLKIQHGFPRPQTNPHPKSTLARPKSTVDLGCERLIRVENGLSAPLFHGPRRPFHPTTTQQCTVRRKSGKSITTCAGEKL